jgi:hypothetical protein
MSNPEVTQDLPDIPSGPAAAALVAAGAGCLALGLLVRWPRRRPPSRTC